MMKFDAVQITMTRPGGTPETVNVSSPEDYRDGDPSALGYITTSWGFLGPLGHGTAAETRMSVSVADPSPLPLGTTITVRISISGPLYADIVDKSLVDEDHVERDFDHPGLWIHALHLLDPVAVAAGRNVVASQPVDNGLIHGAALSAAHPDLIAADIYAATAVSYLLPLDPTANLLDTLRKEAMAGGRVVVATTGGRVATQDIIGASGDAPWWMNPTYHRPYGEGRRIVIPDTGLRHVGTTLNRSSGISRVAVNYSQAADPLVDSPTAVTRVFEDAGDPWPSELTMDTALLVPTATALSDPNMKLLASVATAAVATDKSATLDPTALLESPPLTTVRSLLDVDRRALRMQMVEIDPAPDAASRFHVIVGGTLVIGPDLTWSLGLTLTPATLWGMETIRFAMFKTAPAKPYSRISAVRNSAWTGGTWGRIHRALDVRSARPPL